MSSITSQKINNNIWVATINRPDKLNALNKEVFDELETILDIINSDKTIRCLIITGAGDKAFSSGADLKERQSMGQKEIILRFEKVHALYQRLEQLRIPAIAAMNGIALGGGLELALSCDLRISSSNAQLGFPEVELGIIPGNGGTQRLSRLVGLSRALEITLLARRLNAQQALDIGLIHSVVEPHNVLDAAYTMAKKIVESGPLAMEAAKKAIRYGFECSHLKEALDFEVTCYQSLLNSKDRIEGMKAFIEKRKPHFTGT